MSVGRVFFDTNVLVYLFDIGAPAKQARANQLLVEHASSIVVSTQVLQEFFVTTTTKGRSRLSIDGAERHLASFAALDVVVVEPPRIHAAIALVREHRLSFWDALVVECARFRGCSRLLSEDLQDGREFGRLRIENPFAKI